MFEYWFRCAFVFSITWTLSGSLSELELLKEKDLLTIPPWDGPLPVKVGFYIEHTSGLKAKDMTYNLDIYLRLSWRDTRLAGVFNRENSTKTRHGMYNIDDKAAIYQIWRPDIMFLNVHHAVNHQVTMPNYSLFVADDGTIAHSRKVSLTAHCHMDLHRYPVDQQRCYLQISNYAYTTDEVDMTWFEKGAIGINPAIHLAEFEISRKGKQYCNGEYSIHTLNNSTKADFPCLEARFTVVRVYNFHILQTYLPMALIVSISFVAFFIDGHAVPARVTLSFTSLLTITTQSTGIRFNLPPVSYAKAIDYWVFVCITFVFAGLVEYAFVNSFLLKSKHFGDMVNEEKDQAKEYKEKKKKYYKLAINIDRYSRVLFPLSFIVFIAVYWIMLTLS